MQITQKFVYRQIIQNLAFCHSLAYLSDPSSRLSKQRPTYRFWTFFISSGTHPLDYTAHTLNKGTKRRTGTSVTPFICGWATSRHLKILQTMPETCLDQEILFFQTYEPKPMHAMPIFKLFVLQLPNKSESINFS